MPKRPNILFLMSDQHRADVAGFAGNEVVRTPVLDELARTGTVFTNAYTPAPICVPGRQCMMAGRLPRSCGCEVYGNDLPPGAMTFARRFAQYGYRTVASGKLHHMGSDQMQGWTKRIAPDAEVADPYIDGLRTSEIGENQSEAGTGKWSNQKEIERAGIQFGPHQEFDEVATREAERYIRRHFLDSSYDRPKNDRPLLLKVSLLQPHYPFFTDQERFEYYLNRVDPWIEEPCDHPVLSLSQQNRPVSASPRNIRRATAAYYGMVEQIDSHYGDIIRQLQACGEDLDDWIIVYTTDHGEMLGEHGIWEKTRFYEASVRVPLIIRWPRRFAGGQQVTENVNLCDLFATLCDLASLELPAGLDSRSLVPLIEGSAKSWSDETVSQMGHHHLMIKQGTLKYQYYSEEVPEVLFDLATDPREQVNVIDQPRYADNVASFRRRRGELGHGPSAASDYTNAGYASQ